MGWIFKRSNVLGARKCMRDGSARHALFLQYFHGTFTNWSLPGQLWVNSAVLLVLQIAVRWAELYATPLELCRAVFHKVNSIFQPFKCCSGMFRWTWPDPATGHHRHTHRPTHTCARVYTTGHGHAIYGNTRTKGRPPPPPSTTTTTQPSQPTGIPRPSAYTAPSLPCVRQNRSCSNAAFSDHSDCWGSRHTLVTFQPYLVTHWVHFLNGTEANQYI